MALDEWSPVSESNAQDGFTKTALYHLINRAKKKTGREIACMYRGPPSLLNYCKSFCPKNLQRPELCSSFVMTHEDTVSSHSFPNNYGEEFAEHY